MKIRERKSVTVQQPAANFDLFRLSKSKETVDLSPNTLRGYFKDGLNHYKRGKAVFVSREELRQFIFRQPAQAVAA